MLASDTSQKLIPEISSELNAKLLLVLFYIISGKLGLMLALPPGYTSPIFPPAGIAVAAALIGGKRTLPWIFIGSLILNIWVSYSTSLQINTVGFAVAAIIAIASSLQAGIGGWTLRRMIGYPVALDHSSEVLRFILLAPLICLTSASLSVSGLLTLGVVDPANFLSNWAAWWFGDTLGVIVMLPLVLIAVGEPRALWQRRKYTVAVPMLLAFTLFVMIFLKANQWEYTDSLSDFRQFSQQNLNQVESKLGEQESLLEETASLFLHEANGHITRDGFHRFVQKSLNRFSMVQALEWAPRVDLEHRASFVAIQRKDVPDFEIRETNATGQLLRAADRASFYPVTYVEPVSGNQPAIGFDLSSNSIRQEALTRAIQSGTVIATASVQLVQETQQQAGILLILPVKPHENQSELVLTVLRVGDFMDKLLLKTRPMLYTRLIDLDEKKILYDDFKVADQPALYESIFDFGSRHYRLETAPTPAYFRQHHGWQSWSVLAAGILSTGLLGALFLLGTGYTARIEVLVEDRTQKLKESESRFRNILEHAPIGMAIASLDGQLIQANQALCTILGYEKEELEKLAILDITHPEDVALTLANLTKMLNGETDHYRLEKRFIRKGGQVVWAQLSSYLEKDENGNPLFNIGQIEDITEQKQAEQTRNRLARVLKLLSKCNVALARSESEQELLTEICRLAVETGDYLMAWVGLAEQDATKTVRPIAQYGYVEGYLDNVNITWSDTQWGQGSTGTAIRTGKVVFNNIQDNPKKSPWNEATTVRGYTASIALPLSDKQGIWGALTIYSKDISLQDPEEIVLLEELTKDISFGIDILRSRAGQSFALIALQKESEKNRALLRNASDGIHILDKEGNVIEASDSFCVMLGYCREEVIGMNVSRWDTKFTNTELTQAVRQLFNNPGRTEFITRHRRKDGSVFDVEVSSYPLELAGKPVIFNSSRDITERKLHEDFILKNEQRLIRILNASPIAVRIATEQGRKVVFYNRGYTELIKNPLAEDDDPKKYYADPSEYETILTELARGNSVTNRLIELNIPDSASVWVLASYMPMRYQGEEAVLGWLYDITERKQAEEALSITASVFGSTREAIVITDANNIIIDVNPAFTDISGYTREEALGNNPKMLSSGRQDSQFYAGMWRRLKNEGTWRGEIWNRRKSGEVYAELLSISAICDHSGKVIRYVAVFSDISHIKAHEAALSRVAHYDALTGIPNRVLLADRMKQAIAQTSRDKNMMAVCYLDLDGFKFINDSMGHEAGDQVLIEVAKRIGNTLRGGDTVARLGGDEFVALLLELDKGEECVSTLERLLTAISQPIQINNKFYTISASIGVSIYPQDQDNSDTLLRHADQAMYIAKQSGKNRFHIYDTALDRRARDQHDFLKSIRHGLTEGQFELHYQPKINLLSKALAGAEALIRWRHPERGLLGPGEFLPLIENTELDIEIGEWVIATALKQVHEWHQAGLIIEVSINISGYHLESPHFVEYLKEQLARYPSLPFGNLQIEVLETVALNDIAIVREIIEECRKFGVVFALDDFGTGYSSLSYLSALPVDVLKIDQSFVRDMLEDQGDRAIVQGIVALARAFNRQTVAEGVETEGHYQALRDMGCDLGQGYGIAKPMSAENLLKKWLLQ